MLAVFEDCWDIFQDTFHFTGCVLRSSKWKQNQKFSLSGRKYSWCNFISPARVNSMEWNLLFCTKVNMTIFVVSGSLILEKEKNYHSCAVFLYIFILRSFQDNKIRNIQAYNVHTKKDHFCRYNWDSDWDVDSNSISSSIKTKLTLSFLWSDRYTNKIKYAFAWVRPVKVRRTLVSFLAPCQINVN